MTSLVYINNGYKGNVEDLIKKIRLMCLDPVMRDYLERSVENAEMVLKDDLLKLRKTQEQSMFIDESNGDQCAIEPLETEAIIINPKEEPELYDYVSIMLAHPGYLRRRTAEHRDIILSVEAKRA
ncbi:MAG: hypothetical protein PVH61_13940 [Candidatus Aminicenantes bacterium]|jgi:hypothetical protein